MTYLEQYLSEHSCSEQDFKTHQEDYDGFCPEDVGEYCPDTNISCYECWRREISTI